MSAGWTLKPKAPFNSTSCCREISLLTTQTCSLAANFICHTGELQTTRVFNVFSPCCSRVTRPAAFIAAFTPHVRVSRAGVSPSSAGVKFPDSAGAFHYEDSGKLLSVTSNRFIHW